MKNYTNEKQIKRDAEEKAKYHSYMRKEKEKLTKELTQLRTANKKSEKQISMLESQKDILLSSR